MLFWNNISQLKSSLISFELTLTVSNFTTCSTYVINLTTGIFWVDIVGIITKLQILSPQKWHVCTSRTVNVCCTAHRSGPWVPSAWGWLYCQELEATSSANWELTRMITRSVNYNLYCRIFFALRDQGYNAAKHLNIIRSGVS